MRVSADARFRSVVGIGSALLGLAAAALLVPSAPGESDRPPWMQGHSRARATTGDPLVASVLREASLVGLEPIFEAPLVEIANVSAAGGDAPVRVMAVPEDFLSARPAQATEPGGLLLAWALGWLLLRAASSRQRNARR